MMTREEVFNEAIEILDKDCILANSYADEETPLGFLLCWLKDWYMLPKPDGYDVAVRILKYFEIE